MVTMPDGAICRIVEAAKPGRAARPSHWCQRRDDCGHDQLRRWTLYRNLGIALLFKDAGVAKMGVARFMELSNAKSQPWAVRKGLTDRIRR